jgi:TatD DNase family protein
MPELFDTHAHIQDSEFADDREAVVLRGHAADVASIVVPAVDLRSAHAAIALAEQHHGVFATAGYHPHEASRLDEQSLTQVEALLRNPRVVAVGEIGLDYYRMHSTREEQTDALQRMLELAESHRLPVVVHCRNAWEDMASLLEPWARRVEGIFEGRPLGVLHYFSGSLHEALRYIELGFLISVHTSATHPKGAGLREVVAGLPLDSLVLETDSPYGAPQSHRGRRNEPAYVIEAAKQVAELHGLSLDRVADATTANARRLFRLPMPAGR